MYTHTGTQGPCVLGKEVLKSINPPDSSKINHCQKASSDSVLTQMFPLWGLCLVYMQWSCACMFSPACSFSRSLFLA